MDPLNKGPAKFYQMFKVHKSHNAPETPPERPIISASGSVTENVGLFVEHHIKDFANKHPSYLQDTPDFLRMLEARNAGQPLPKNAILVTLDVSSLYTNIPQDEGLDCIRECLNDRINPEVPTDLIVKMMEIVLKHNIFEFNQELFIQLIGTAMGCRPAPSYANIFMAKKIDPEIVKIAQSLIKDKNPVDTFKRFLDDIFMIYTGSISSLHELLNELNCLHPSIKFTMSHTTPPDVQESECDCLSVDHLAFLDTSCRIVDGKVLTDLYRKETDRNQYLLPSSCHPAHVSDNIPYSLALRIVRICSLPEDREKKIFGIERFIVVTRLQSKIN